ncbi:ribonuclease P protein subunit p40 [Thalassophryne amazonica]|uniref:ribonuclease P protein subunit p40 n=1 Tax=Thalassophryne amazonica TaxID=390379 RepID=UPI001470E23D|nr:ribonuclease P protein subunit p40 [Thalassophryne amazonica]
MMTAALEKTPRTLLVCDKSSFLNEKCRVSAQVEQHHFNYKASVLLPECSSAPSHLETVLSGFSSFYLIRRLPLYQLLDEHFLKTAVYQGSVYGLSYGCRLDEDNCVALLPHGGLVLSLDKDSFELLGLEGKRSQFSRRTSSRYVVCVNLTDSGMVPGGRGYQRLLTGLKSRVPLEMDFLLSHRPGGGSALQELLSRHEWTEHRPEVHRRTLTHLLCPTPESCDAHSFLDWLGAVDADVSCHNLSSDFLSTFVCPEPQMSLTQALNISITGFLSREDIHRLIQELRRYLELPRPVSWVALTVHGFTDSPVSWADTEHGVLQGGENFYSLLLFRDHTYRHHMAASAYDGCPA